jgi:hypothetical protein
MCIVQAENIGMLSGEFLQLPLYNKSSICRKTNSRIIKLCHFTFSSLEDIVSACVLNFIFFFTLRYMLLD